MYINYSPFIIYNPCYSCLKPVCSPDLQSLTSVNAVSCWNTETIEEPLRHFTKKLGKAKHSIKWRLLNQNISTISAFKSKQIQWESSWRTTMLSYIDRNVTNNKETRQRAFNVKLFNNELPTLEKLKDRFSKIYENDSCIRCNLEKEDQVHVLTCPKNLIDIHSCRNKLINLLVNKTTTIACGDTCKKMCKTLEALKELHIPRDVNTRDTDHLSFIDIMLGLIPITAYDIVLQKVVTHELADQIMDDVFVQFKLFLHTHIWKDRCTAVKKWETENGISNNKWKKKIRNETLDTIVTSQTNNTDNNSVLNNNLQSLTSVNAVSCWNTETIEEPLRHFTKKLGKAKHSIKWRLLNQNISTISAFKSKQIQWESSWRTTMLSYIDRNVTNNKETRQRAFNVKLFNNELPTLEKLKDRFSKIYENDSCIRCNLEKEDQVHVLTCPKNLIDIHSCRNKLINLLVNKTTTIACGDTCKKMCKTLEALKELHIPRDVNTRDTDHLSFIDIMLGLIPITAYDIVLQKVVTHELADQIMDDVFVQFKLFLHTHIWKDRCTAVKKWETENGISNNKWKKKIRNETLDTIVTSQTNNTDNNSVLNNMWYSDTKGDDRWGCRGRDDLWEDGGVMFILVVTELWVFVSCFENFIGIVIWIPYIGGELNNSKQRRGPMDLEETKVSLNQRNMMDRRCCKYQQYILEEFYSSNTMLMGGNQTDTVPLLSICSLLEEYR
ncbi:hypothetical protein Glove_209g152 [Diversispora epigaea]|uniref:Uncharacterized protein n=1 Tax=Diversispora epigaea TaxID=1348612 RepID=A0A397ISA1_9GLOM|nr:hypothetical protein Glove_209g152 [Diversispora epigaea]